MTERTPTSPNPVAVLDMGASAVRLVVAELRPDAPLRVIEEASKGVLLGRDTFASGVIQAETIDATCVALDGFRKIIDQYGVVQIRAVATSAVREARNSNLFLDRIRRRTGFVFEVINETEESRLVYLAVRDALHQHPAFAAPWSLLVEVGGGSTGLMLLRRGQPSRSGIYALGAVRLRQQLRLRRHPHDMQVALLKRSIAKVIDEIRLEIPLKKVAHVIAIGGDVRFAASQIEAGTSRGAYRDVPRAAFFDFCHRIEGLDHEQLVDQFRLPGVEAETFLPAVLVYRMLLAETAARRLVVSDATLRTGVLLDFQQPRRRQPDFDRQVLASAEAVGERYKFDRAHGRHVARLAVRLFDELGPDHGLSARERLLLETAALLHDIGVFVSIRAHHKHSQYLLAASQIFGLSDEETAMVSNIARYHRRGLPQRSHVAYIALDRQDQLIVHKLAAILRVANALDAEHLQKVTDLKVVRSPRTWVLELTSSGDVTMEQMAATSRADLFHDVFGHKLAVRVNGGIR